VGVAVQRSLGVAVLRLVASEVPDDQGLVTAAGEEHVGAIENWSVCIGVVFERGQRTSPKR
jgi:hypothetical protein